MTDHDDQRLLDLCRAKRLLNDETAAKILQRAQREGRPVATVLNDMGVIARHTIDALKRELDQEPRAISGFRILRKLGQGGMGTVYLAEQTSLHRQVALKVIAPQFSADAQMVDRFMREARSAAAVNHPNIISVIDVGYDQGQLYMALELVTGGDAAHLAERVGGVLPETRALEIIADCCRGLHALYEARLIHRDIKPANIFITKDGVAKLADLGLARREQDDARLTASGFAVGTPAFMSPEQAEGKPDIDIRSDLYALGASLFELVTGSPPFTGNGIYVIAAKVLTQPAPDARTLNPRLSTATCRVIARCLAKAPAERFQSPHELSLALAEALAGVAVVGSSSAQTRAVPPTPPTAPLRRPRSAAVRRPARSAPWPALVAAGVVAALAGIGWMMVGTSTVGTRSVPGPGAASDSRDARKPAVEQVPEAQPSRPPTVAASPSVQPTVQPSLHPSLPAIPGLIAHWPFDEGSGTQVRDLTGISSPGTIVNASWTTGRIGGALAFSRPSMVRCGNSPRLSPGSELTVMCWLKAPRNTVTHEPVSVLRHDRHFTALQLTHDGNAHAVGWYGDHVNPAVFRWQGVWDDERWHHFAVTYHQEHGMRIFRDGAPHLSEPQLKGPLPASAEPFVIGASEKEGEYFTGVLDDVRVYERALTAQEIAVIAGGAR